MPNIREPEWDQLRDHPGFLARRARVGHQAGAQRLGLSAWEVEPGQAAYPYHLHFGEEELLVLLEGRPILRTPEGRRRLEEGEVLSFLVGEEGAHQLINDTDAVVRFLSISTQGAPDIVLYPDSGKLGAADRRPDGSVRDYYRRADAVDYYEGETAPELDA